MKCWKSDDRSSVSNNFDYPDSLLSGPFSPVPNSPDNRGLTVGLRLRLRLRRWCKPDFTDILPFENHLKVPDHESKLLFLR